MYYSTSTDEGLLFNSANDIIKLAYILYREFIHKYYAEEEYHNSPMTYSSWLQSVTIDGNAGGFWIQKATNIIDQLENTPA